MRRTYSVLLLAALTVFSASQARAEDGVSPTEIKVGVINVITGPVGLSGQYLTAGGEAYFNKVNREGGINGRKIKHLHYDDKYEPAVAVEMTKKAIEQDKVFALINFNGTPTAKAALPIVKKANVPFLFPRTGDPAVREPFDKNIFNLRASFPDEMDALIGEMVKRKKTKIAVLVQKDGFGDVIKSGTRKAMEAKGVGAFVAEGTVERNSSEIKDAFAKIEAANPEVVVLAVTAAAATPFAKMSAEKGKTWIMLSANNNNPIAEKLKGQKIELIFSQVVPNPSSSGLAIAKEFQAEMKTMGRPELADDLTAFEGYINAAAFAEAVKRAGKDLTRASLISALESKPMDLGGFKVEWSASSHNGKSPVFLTKFQDGSIADLK